MTGNPHQVMFIMSNGIIGWSSKKQLYIFLSLTKAEYMATFQKKQQGKRYDFHHYLKLLINNK
jgi:hypothetical protein